MRTHGSRTIKILKSDLIDTLNKNKDNHIVEYGKAVIGYKKEALKQLANLEKIVNDGSLKIRLDLVTPVNSTENYDKIIEMFEWEINEEVELTQDEFKEYVQDESSFAISAKFSNQTYFNS